MKTKTVTFEDDIWTRIESCMAATRIFNASDFVRLCVKHGVEKIEAKYGLTPSPTKDNGTGANSEDVVES